MNETSHTAAAVRAAWADRSTELAAWAVARLVVRRDVWGGYSNDGQITLPSVLERAKKTLTDEQLRRHFAAKGRRDVIGTHSTTEDDRSIWGAVDIDAHAPDGDGGGETTPNESAALGWYSKLVGLGFQPLLTASNGKGGFHLRILVEQQTDTAGMFAALRGLTDDHADYGLEKRPETFPKQSSVRKTAKRAGNWLRMPGRHHTRDYWSAVWDGAKWLDGTEAVAFILGVAGDPAELLAKLAPTPPAEPEPVTPTPPSAEPADQWSVPSSNGSATAYGRRALEAEINRVLVAPAGQRNDTLNTAAFRMGQLVGGHALSREEAERGLVEAGIRAGLMDAETRATVRSGLEAGLAAPRTAADRNGTPNANGTANAHQNATPTVYTLVELLTIEFPPPVWAVAGLLPQGLTLLAGKPKLGKSWCALNLAITVAGGGKALGNVEVTAGDVLYLALEDRWQRLQSRARKMMPGALCGPSARLQFATVWPRAHEGGIALIAKWLARVPEPRLVIVDVWQKFKPPMKSGGSQYEQDYAHASELKGILDEKGCAGLALHHTKKAAAEDVFDEVSGTLGLTGAADSTLILARARNETEATLHQTGRDVEERKLAIRFDPATCTWHLEGDADQREGGKIRQAILKLFRENPSTSWFPKEMAEAIRLNPDSVRVELNRMFREGVVRKIGSKFTWPIQDTEEIPD